MTRFCASNFCAVLEQDEWKNTGRTDYYETEDRGWRTKITRTTPLNDL
jgi:hypothetical protein